MISVLFVCMGNICRSPTAEGVFRKHVVDAGLEDRIHTDSAGTHAYHEGEGPDRRARAAAERRGFSLEGLKARRVTEVMPSALAARRRNPSHPIFLQKVT